MPTCLPGISYLRAKTGNLNRQKRMALLEKQLYLKKSTIPDSGKGLFTKKFIPKGTRIVEYRGKIRTWKEMEKDEADNGYIMYINRNHVIDARPTTKFLGRYANDAKGLVKVKGLTNNSEYVTENKRVFIDAKRDIPAGGEILVGYGKDYWKVVRENMRLEQKNRKK